MRKGTTLVEVLVSSLILVIAIGGIAISVNSYTVVITKHIKEKEAAFVLQQELENIQALGSREAILDNYIDKYYGYQNSAITTINDEDGNILETYNIYFENKSTPTLGLSSDFIGSVDEEGDARVLEYTAVASWNNDTEKVKITTRCPN